MLGTYTHSRAAILCFGGWGLQVMLHLAPRLRAVQEQRAALKAQGPDLDRMTSMGALLPDALLDAEGYVELQMRRPRPDHVWQPFFVERLLSRIRHGEQFGEGPGADGELSEAVARILTASERRALQLLRAAEPALAPMTYEGYTFRTPAKGLAGAVTPGSGQQPLRRATRGDVFSSTLEHADPIARLAETYLLDPIRQDNLAPDDPYVQTTLYVVAPLFEPLAAAMIWPSVATIMARLGRRHISNVVALFATGGYAEDLTRPIEDATAHATLAELELLTGQRSDPGARAALADMIAATGSRLTEHVGESIFDHIYLLDREKSNQGLAEDSHELAVLAGNALEALVVGSGDLFIQEQLGFTIHTPGEKRPYSLIGAAGDYVPLQQILHAVNRQEESRLVREWVLRSTPPEDSPPVRQNGLRPGAKASRGPAPAADSSLADLGFTVPDALGQLARRMPDMFEQHELQSVEDLAVNARFVLPPSAAAELRRTSMEEWPEAFARHMEEVRQTFQLATGTAAIDEAWGIPNADSDTSLAVAAGLEGDDRHFPSLLVRMHKGLADMLAASPAGLTLAVEQTTRWQREVEEALQKLRVASTPSTRQLNKIQHDLNLREWTLRYSNVIAKMPSGLGIFVRATASIAFVALLSLLFLVVVQRQWDWQNDGLSLAGFGAGILLAAIFTYRVHLGRRTALRRARVELAQAELTDQLRMEAHSGLVRAYSRLNEILQGWQDMLGEAVQTLHSLSTPPTIPAVPPPGVEQTYLYQAHVNQALWDRCLAYLRSHLDTQGQRSEERLDDLWGTVQWRNRMQEILRTSAARAGGRKRRGQSQAQGLAEFIRQTVRESVSPVSLQDDSPVREALIRALKEEYSVEYLLWRGAAESRDIERRLRAMSAGLPSADLATARNEQLFTSRRYVESAWHRSKPTANYDVADRLAVYGITIDFAAVSGDGESELTRNLLDEFGVALLPTENPFTLLFVRTVHGLALDDLDCMRRYQEEMRHLRPSARALVELVSSRNRDLSDTLYQTATPSDKWSPPPLSLSSNLSGNISEPSTAPSDNAAH